MDAAAYKKELANMGGKVLVAGANGATGKEVVKLLRELEVPVRALVRRTQKATDAGVIAGPGLEVVEGDGGSCLVCPP